MTYEQIFKDVKKYFIKANASHFTQEFAFQFNITGEGEGIFYAAFKNGVLSVEPYDYVDRDVIFEADGETLKDIASGKLEVIDAVKAGKLAIDGDHEAAKQIIFLSSTKKPVAKKEAAKTDEKPAAKNEAAKTDEKPAAKKEAEKTDEKPAVKKEAAKTDEKPAVKKEAAKTDEKPAVKKEAAKTDEKPAAKKDTSKSTKTSPKK